MMTDLRFALRQLRKSPGFTFLAVITLTLGIGLNTAIFSLINDLFLKGLPFQEPARVLHLMTRFKERTDDFPMSAPRYLHYRDGQTIFSGFAAENGLAATVSGLGDPFQVPIFKATYNYFDVLGVHPILGRTFLKEEEEGADVAIITDRFWRARFAGNPDVIGKTIALDGVAHTIVGVIPKMPVSWTGPNVDIWTTKPLVIPGFSQERMMRGTAFLRVIGRLKPGITVDQAKAACDTLGNAYQTQFPEKIDAKVRSIVKTLPEDVTENLRPGFITLLAAVAFVLLIACSNVANLLLVRFSGRRREISLRLALGGTRGSVIRLFVFESVLISLLAGILGAVLAWQLVPLIPRLAANFLPIEPGSASAVSVAVLAFTIGLSLLTGLIMGLYPALQGSRTDIVDALKEGGRGTAGSVRQQRFRKVLVGAQVALSVTLLAGASLLIASFVRLSQQDPGFKTDNLWVGFTFMPQAKYPDQATRARFAEQLQNAIRSAPGMQDVMISSGFPLNGGAGATLYTRPEGNVPPVAERKGAPSNDVTPGWFRSLGIPLLAGRDFNEQDVLDHPNVIIISKAGAKTVFGDENPIGKSLLITSGSVPVEIVGVVGDVRHQGLDQRPEPELYVTLSQSPPNQVNLVVRTASDPKGVAASIRRVVSGLDSDQPVYRLSTMEKLVADAGTAPRFRTLLLSAFGGLALVLAAIGIYGVMSFSVAQRRQEIGIRITLGAQSGDVLRLVVREGIGLIAAGGVIGLAATLALTRLLQGFLYEVRPTDPATLVTVATVLAAVGLFACWLPARRATRVDPMEALRHE